MKNRPFKKNFRKAKFLVRRRIDTFTVVELGIATIEIKDIFEHWGDIISRLRQNLQEQNIAIGSMINPRLVIGVNPRAKKFIELKQAELVREGKIERARSKGKRKKRLKNYNRKKRKELSS